MWLWLCLLVIVVLLFVIWFFSEKPPSIIIKDSHAIITGGSSGIGLALAKELALKGAHVTIIARDQKKLGEAKEVIENYLESNNVFTSKLSKILTYSADVTDYQALSAAISDAINKVGRVDILICSAGDTRPERFDDMDPKYFDHIMKVNYLGSVNATKCVIPHMKNRNSGRIVYVSSILGLFGYPSYAVYSASKFALRGLAESLQLEYCPWNIHFSISVPPNVNTPMFEKEEKYKPPETKALEGTHDVVQPEHIASSIIDTFSNYRFVVPYGTDAFLVSMVTGGFAPGSFLEILLQFAGAGILRIVSVIYLWSWKRVIKKYRLKNNEE
jgi:3-dehydrosphinganine reductase